MKNLKYIIVLAVLLSAGLYVYNSETKTAFGVGISGMASRIGVNTTAEIQNFNFLTATSTTATSTNSILPGAFTVAGAEKIQFYFSRGDVSGNGNAGQSRFKVQVSNDGSNWIDFNRLVLATSTSNTSYVSTVNISATSSASAIMDITLDNPYQVRCIVFEVTDGEHTCTASALWK